MGIPGFYRWMASKYRQAVADVVEDFPFDSVDATMPNPNGVEFDNLYMDMNGIIHPCFHPEDYGPPQTYGEVFGRVYTYIDRIFSMIRPRKLLYLAIDGVAPRAKMNQQRARRFKAVTEKGKMLAMGKNWLRSRVQDSNVITPGTEFMELLSSALQYYIHWKINADPGWDGVKVILSDASVPGEGEHKIMSYIRLQRNLPGYDPNTRHCLYGLDADLIMLGLATHEVHFSILREDVSKGSNKKTKKKTKKQAKRIKKWCVNLRRGFDGLLSRQKFQFLHMWVLRDCLAESLEIPDSPVEIDLERLVDDFVFMCLFVGNDFLPHVPSLELSEGAIELLISVYKAEFVRMGGYITDSSEVNLERLGHFVQTLGSHEDAIFKKRSQGRGKKWLLLAKDPRFVKDEVKLGEDGWKERYYDEKFKVKTDSDRETVKKHAVLKYVEGICWVMHYYYQGVCSWQWFYPYHYAPSASDFCGLDQLKVEFVLGEPFKPFNQLMGVLPAASAHALPLFYRDLMTKPTSPILDFYPTRFELDLNGKKQIWKAICRLPFIDEGRLLAETAKVEHTLTDAERQRNNFGLNKLFFHVSHPLAAKIFTFFERNKDNPGLHKAKVKKKINPDLSGGMNGYVYISDKPICPAVVPSPLHGKKTIMNNKVMIVLYKYPEFHPHIPRPPAGVIMHEEPVGRPKPPRPEKKVEKRTPVPNSEPSIHQIRAAKLKERNRIKTLKYALRRNLEMVSFEGTINVEELEEIRKRAIIAISDKTTSKLRSACLVSETKDRGEVGKMTNDALNDNNTKTHQRLKKACLATNSEEQGEIGQMTHDPVNADNIIKVENDCLVSKSGDQGEVGKMTNDALNDINTKTERDRRKRKRSVLNRKLKREACLASNGEEQGEIGEVTHGDPLNADNTTKMVNACLVSKSEDQGEVEKRTNDALEDINTKTECNRRKRIKYTLNRRLKKACLASNGEEQGVIGETTHDSRNDEATTKMGTSSLVSSNEDQGLSGKIMTNDAQNDKLHERESKSACFTSNCENKVKVGELKSDALNEKKALKLDGNQGEVVKTTHDAIKLDRTCLVSKREGEGGEIANNATNGSSKKKRRNKKKKLDNASLVSNSEVQGVLGKIMTNVAQNDKLHERESESSCFVSNCENQVKVGELKSDALNNKKATKLDSNQGEVGKTTHDAIKLDSSCLVSKREEQGEGGEVANNATNGSSKKRRNKKKKLDNACLVSNSEVQGVLGKIMTNDAQNDKLHERESKSACFASNCENQVKVGELKSDALNDKKVTKLDSNQVEVGKTTHDAIKLDSSCLVSKREEQGEGGQITNNATNGSSKKRRRNKKKKLDNACLVSNSDVQGVLGKLMTNDAQNDKLHERESKSACFASNCENQVKVGELKSDALNDKKATKLDSNQGKVGKMTHDAIKLDSSCLVSKREEQGEVGKVTNNATNGSSKKRKRNNQKRKSANTCLVGNGEDQVEVRTTSNDTNKQVFGQLWNVLQGAMSQTRGLQT